MTKQGISEFGFKTVFHYCDICHDRTISLKTIDDIDVCDRCEDAFKYITPEEKAEVIHCVKTVNTLMTNAYTKKNEIDKAEQEFEEKCFQEWKKKETAGLPTHINLLNMLNDSWQFVKVDYMNQKRKELENGGKEECHQDY